MKKLLIINLFVFALIFSAKAQDEKHFLQGGLMFQKVQKLYWENGFALDYSNKNILDRKIHFGFAYASSRFGSAMGSNAIKQDNFIVSANYHFFNKKKLNLTLGFNTGFFNADYEIEAFDVLDKNSLLLALNIGVAYKYNDKLTASLSTGYNIISGNGASGPGTLFPVYYRMAAFYSIFNK